MKEYPFHNNVIFFLFGIRALTEKNESFAARNKVPEEDLFKIKADEEISTGVLNILT